MIKVDMTFDAFMEAVIREVKGRLSISYIHLKEEDISKIIDEVRPLLEKGGWWSQNKPYKVGIPEKIQDMFLSGEMKGVLEDNREEKYLFVLQDDVDTIVENEGVTPITAWLMVIAEHFRFEVHNAISVKTREIIGSEAWFKYQPSKLFEFNE